MNERNGGSLNVIAELSAELGKERKKNAELMEKISLLEAQLQERDKASAPKTAQDVCPIVIDRSLKKFKRQKHEWKKEGFEHREIAQHGYLTNVKKQDTSCQTLNDKGITQQDLVVNWMTMDDAQFLNFEKCKDGDFPVDYEDTDDSDDKDDENSGGEDAGSDNARRNDESPQFGNTLSLHMKEEVGQGGIDNQFSQRDPSGESEMAVMNMIREISRDLQLPDIATTLTKKEHSKDKRRERKEIKGCKELRDTYNVGQEIGCKGMGSISSQKKHLKVPFCPKEIKRLIRSQVLLQKNAQSHTIRKIIVFASLGIRHGCEDMYELDFNHFSILQKGEPYVSPTNPGEHVLYEHPGVRRKIFYPNRQNPALCPIQILEEEKAMRPSDLSFPSCLFLCIKYGGRTRNLPQNEYVRQRMGRNKLKSFGPLMCQMAMLANNRSGSFFFKALGITLLFMAGFPDNFVQKETKYRNLDLLQKYYRRDEEAAGEELFQLCAVPYDVVIPNSQNLSGKTTKSSTKRQTGLTSKPRNPGAPAILPSGHLCSAPPTQFGLMGYASLENHARAGLQCSPSHTVPDAPSTPNNQITTSSPNFPYNASQAGYAYPMFPPHPANTFMPMVYWPHINAFPPCPYPASYGYRPFPHSMNYMSLHSQHYYGHASCTSVVPKVVECSGKKEETGEEAESDSGSSSSSTEPKTA